MGNPRSTEICGIRWEHAATVHILALNDITGNKINIVSGSIVGQG